jgi:hypothetical protein
MKANLIKSSVEIRLIKDKEKNMEIETKKPYIVYIIKEDIKM